LSIGFIDQASIKHETGRESFKQGEQLKINENGSVTSRIEKNGNYSETTSKDSKPIETKAHVLDGKGGFTDTTENKGDGTKRVREQDKDGNYTETSFGRDGKKTGDISHKTNPDGSITDAVHDGSGNVVANRDTNTDGSYND
jgi:hypothetical protein